jgi:hypothetical protein
MKDMITVVVPTCPRPSHPSTKILDATIASVRRELPDAHIIITCDGPRDTLSQTDLVKYGGFISAIEGRYENARVVRFTERGHQTGNMQAILPDIKTPIIFYVEDDWQILPNVQWKLLGDLILRGEYNYIKLYPQARISPWHEHHMFRRVHHEIGSEHVFMVQTNQFSANPHLAATDWYQGLYANGMLRDRVDFIEEALHGTIGQCPWEAYKLGIYNPDHGDMYRCLHLDGKGSL